MICRLEPGAVAVTVVTGVMEITVLIGVAEVEELFRLLLKQPFPKNVGHKKGIERGGECRIYLHDGLPVSFQEGNSGWKLVNCANKISIVSGPIKILCL